jgi:group I intron endonuclease
MEKIKSYCVYIHENKINGKKYVGQTCQKPKDRWDSGRGYKTCTYFNHAIQKYGWDNFEHIIVAENLTKEEANKIEKELISFYDTMNPQYGYNLTSGGEGISGFKLTDEQRKKISEAQIGKEVSDETRRKIGESHIGMKHTDEAKEIMRKKHLRENLSQETLEKMSSSAKKRLEAPENNPFFGKHHTDETCALLSDIAKNRFENKENHPMYGKHHTDETKQKLIDVAPSKSVIQFSLDKNIVKIFISTRGAERETGIAHQHIIKCCKDEPFQRTAGGYYWMYKDEYLTVDNFT